MCKYSPLSCSRDILSSARIISSLSDMAASYGELSNQRERDLDQEGDGQSPQIGSALQANGTGIIFRTTVYINSVLSQIMTASDRNGWF